MRLAFGQPFISLGTKIHEIPVSISYRIIELFSAGLYSSPYKAIEELVANSYDAMAGVVDLFIPGNLDAAGATIWVVDDGESMDLEGLVDLWQIARSKKRSLPESVRPPIGKFGIGKLATYVLAYQLTYLCRTGGQVLGVTMDFGRIAPEQDAATHVMLDVREFGSDEVVAALAPLRQQEGGRRLVDRLLGNSAPASWTVVAMSNLRPPAQNLQIGRLRWILSTALPMSPAFQLKLNGRSVASALDRSEALKSWRIGENADLPKKLASLQGADEDGPYVEIDGISGRLRGRADLYADVLTKGKAAALGRSHGFFIMVRGRLINLDDALFGVHALSHATFNRFRMIVHADGLDEFLASTREAIMDSPAARRFRDWLRDEFNTARGFYDTWAAEREREALLSTRIGRTTSSLSRRPLVNAITSVLNGHVRGLLLTEVPRGLGDEERLQFIAALEDDLESESGLIPIPFT